MSRIEKLPLEKWDPELRELLHADEATSFELGWMRMVAHVPGMAKGMAALNAGIFTNSPLPRRLAELVRLRIAFHNSCRSCMSLRYKSAVDDGITENLVCSLERPEDAADMSDAEKAAIAFADQSCLDHFSINDETFDNLRKHFTEQQIVALCVIIAVFIGFGRMVAAWDMTEELPEGFRKQSEPVGPWSDTGVLVRG